MIFISSLLIVVDASEQLEQIAINPRAVASISSDRIDDTLTKKKRRDRPSIHAGYCNQVSQLALPCKSKTGKSIAVCCDRAVVTFNSASIFILISVR